MKYPFLLLLLIGLIGCGGETETNITTDEGIITETKAPIAEDYKKTTPEWSKDDVMYEVNIRQYTPEGNFKAFEAHLPRLKELGVDILWLMPIQPIGEKKRKGDLGSYYSIKDYKKVNPEHGTLQEFKALVDKAHDMGFKVILDWVANHSAWDNDMIRQHPEWYTVDSNGRIKSPVEDWSDVADLNYDQPGLRAYMIEAMKFWVQEADIDGFRCDVAGFVPTDFWDEARKQLDQVKPVFMLAEWEDAELHTNAFDATYGWELHHIMNEVAQGKKSAQDITDYFKKQDTTFRTEDYRLYFTSNHDENSWNGTTAERMGDAHEALAVLSFTVPGMPLIYSGQEAGLDRRLSFFGKDSIDWSNLEMTPFYEKLVKLKHDNPALWNGEFGGEFELMDSQTPNILFFSRKTSDNEIWVVLNLSDTDMLNAPSQIMLRSGVLYDVFSGEQHGKSLGPWGYQVYIVQEASN